MLELSLHILDLLENSLAAGARTVRVTLVESEVNGLLEISVEDDGPGLAAPYEKALDPFYTTKQGKRVGLGLSLFRATAEQAGGSLTLGKSEMGGLLVKASFRLCHVDLPPLGDLPTTFATMLAAHPEIEWICRLVSSKDQCLICSTEVKNEIGAGDVNDSLLALRFAHTIKSALQAFYYLPDKAIFTYGG